MAIRRDIGFRLAHHGEKLHPDGIAVDVTEIPTPSAPEAFLEIEGLRIEAFEVDHRPVVPAFGYRARYDGRTVVLSGDTALCDSLADAAAGADLFVCEALNTSMLDRQIAMLRAAGHEHVAAMLGDVPSYHIRTDEIAALSARAGVGEVVLSHILPPIPNDADTEAAFMAGMADAYGGSIRVARDLQRITVERRGA